MNTKIAVPFIMLVSLLAAAGCQVSFSLNAKQAVSERFEHPRIDSPTCGNRGNAGQLQQDTRCH